LDHPRDIITNYINCINTQPYSLCLFQQRVILCGGAGKLQEL
jgi:hypothetical protein